MTMSGYKKVAVGGTFDVFHRGHRALLDKAFEVGESVLIGLASDVMAGEGAADYEKRKGALEDLLEPEGRYDIVELNEPLGDAATDGTIDAIVVSEETATRALEINEVRQNRGLNALEIISIPLVTAEDGKPMSSTRVKRGEIDKEGRVLPAHK